MSKFHGDHDFYTCQNCKHRHEGKVCNLCGEKNFDASQLSAKHFLNQVVDFFFHWENKVLKSLKLNFLQPGFITKENLNGVRIPYAKPIQLYLVAGFVFYLVISKLGISDYVPSYGDHGFFLISDNRFLKWAEPLDNYMISGIDSMWVKKGREIQKTLDDSYRNEFQKGNNLVLKGRKTNPDSLIIDINKTDIIAFRNMTRIRYFAFRDHISVLGKSLLFILIPFIACIFYLIFYKKLKYFGSSLLFATHFMVYNLCFYTIYQFINYTPVKLGLIENGWMFTPFRSIFYNDITTTFSQIVFGADFCFLHLVIWMPWLFIAFRRLFKTHWLKSLILALICGRVFYFLIFGLYKKILIAYTIYSLHV